jgi:phospholipase A1
MKRLSAMAMKAGLFLALAPAVAGAVAPTLPAADPAAPAASTSSSESSAAPAAQPPAPPAATPGPASANVPVTAEPAPPATQLKAEPKHTQWFQFDPDAYSIVSAGRGLSLHKPMYLLPFSWSEDYHGRATEILFELSLKQRMFGIPLYFAYTQKSFWQAYNSKDSRPFRETDFNPEVFYRWIPPDRVRWHHLGADFGFEHESNGQPLPDSRSWNRLYIAPFQAAGNHVIYWKWWWRIPEDNSKPRTDPQRDDNPDIHDYYGYSELSVEQQLGDKQLIHAMLRWNPMTGKGGFNLQYTIPGGDQSFFWMLYFWQGYGESLIDYNHSITRIGIGVALAR